MKRVQVFKNCSGSPGKVIATASTLQKLLEAASSNLGIHATHLYTLHGALLEDVTLLRDDDILYATEGEGFQPQLSHSSVQQQPLGYVWPPIYKSELPSAQEWVTLNVGGHIFTTTRATLVTKDPNSMLARMFNWDDTSNIDNKFIPSNRDGNGAFLIDRSYCYFEPILNFLRNGTLILDNGTNPEGVLEEAKFFGIESVIPILESLIKSKNAIKLDREDPPLNRGSVIKAILGTDYRAELRFQGVNLQCADLSKLDLRNINFKYADLSGCNLSGANLTGCCLERAQLSGANLEGAQLLNVRLLCANLEGTNMKSCNFEDPAGTRANCEGVNLRGAQLEGSMMAGVNLRVATLKNANLRNCDLRAAVLAGADMENCDLTGSDLQEANLRGANLKDALFNLMLTPLHMSQTMTCDL